MRPIWIIGTIVVLVIAILAAVFFGVSANQLLEQNAQLTEQNKELQKTVTAQETALTDLTAAADKAQAEIKEIGVQNTGLTTSAELMAAQIRSANKAVETGNTVLSGIDPVTEETVIYGSTSTLRLVDPADGLGPLTALEIPEAPSQGHASGVLLACGAVTLHTSETDTGLAIPKESEHTGTLAFAWNPVTDAGAEEDHDLNMTWFASDYVPGHCQYTSIVDAGNTYEDFLNFHVYPAIYNMIGGNANSGTNCGDGACVDLVHTPRYDLNAGTISEVDLTAGFNAWVAEYEQANPNP